jgi:hypothetical protein
MVNSGAAWSAAPSEAPQREFNLAQVRMLDVDAVRLCDGYEYRYHPGGDVTFFSLRTGEELRVSAPLVLPELRWWHLAGCACPACAPL